MNIFQGQWEVEIFVFKVQTPTLWILIFFLSQGAIMGFFEEYFEKKSSARNPLFF